MGLLVEFVLAPITSWSIDTPGFVSAGISLIYNGSPYAANQFFNAPLGPFLEAPLFALLSIWFTPQSLIVSVSAINPAASATGISTQIPTFPALLALKTPLILSALVSSLCVLYLSERIVGRVRARFFAAAWILNPLLIWATAVHGEVDILATTAVLLFLVAILEKWYLFSGVALALGVMSKVYPIVLLPMAVVLVSYHTRSDRAASPIGPTVRFLAGLGLGILPFVAFFPQLVSLYGGLYSQPSYGGFNVLLLFNPGIFRFGAQHLATTFSLHNAVLVHDGFVVTFVISMIASVISAELAAPKDGVGSRAPGEAFFIAILLPLTGVLLYQPSPQSENLLLILPFLLLLSCYGNRWAKAAYFIISAAGLLLYFTLLTPFAFFYPLAVLGGNSWISAINHILINYNSNSVLPLRSFWIVAGITGGGAILGTCIAAIYRTFEVTIRRIRGLGRTST